MHQGRTIKNMFASEMITDDIDIGLEVEKRDIVKLMKVMALG